MNKVLFGIKNVHIAKLKEDEDGKITYDTPIGVPGATGFSPDPKGDSYVYYADNKIYYRKTSNQGYEGDLVVATIPEEVLIEIFGRTKDKNGAIIENSDDKQSRFALMFEGDGDEKARRFVYWDCTASRPTKEHKTNEETIEVEQETMPIVIAPRSTDNQVGAYLEPSTQNKAVYDKFFETVYEQEKAESI